MPLLGNKFRDIYRPYRIFTVLSLFFLAGILLASFWKLSFDRSWPVLLVGIIGFLGCAFVNYLLKNHLLALISFGLISLTLALSYYSSFEKKVTPVLAFGSEVDVEAKVAVRPEIDYKKQKLILQYHERGQEINLLVNVPSFPAYHFGEILRIKGTLTKPENFDGFDYQGYLKQKLVFGLVNQPQITYIGTSESITDRILGSLYFVSASFEKALNAVLPEPEASLASGILLGVKRNISDNLMDALSKTGLTHIIALSGFNVTIIVIIFSDLTLTYLGRRKVFYFGTMLVLLFVLMTGAASSVVRAAIFSLLILFGKAFGRQADETNIVLLAALVMILFDPFVLRYDLGFQLSFLAFTGLIYLSPLIRKFFERKKLRFIPLWIKSPLVETLGAQFAVAPLIWFQFGRLSLISPLANLLVVPLVPISMGLIAVTGLLSLAYQPLGLISSYFTWPILAYFVKAVELLAQVPFASLGK